MDLQEYLDCILNFIERSKDIDRADMDFMVGGLFALSCVTNVVMTGDDAIKALSHTNYLITDVWRVEDLLEKKKGE